MPPTGRIVTSLIRFQHGATRLSLEEAETAIGLAALLLRETGADEDRIRAKRRRIHAKR